MSKLKTCCLCGKKFTEYGNNPFPLKDTGVCCDACNMAKVIPARLKEIYKTNVDIMYGKDEN